MFFAVTIDLTGINAFLSRPDVLIYNALLYVGWIPILSVMVWGFMEVWIHHRQEHYRHHQKNVLLAVDAPKLSEQSPIAMQGLFSTVAAAWGGPNFREKWIDGEVSPVFSFEIVSIGGYVQYYIRTPTKYRDMIEAGLYAAYPDVEITEAEDYTKDSPDKFPDENYRAWGCEQKLKKPHYFPIRTIEMFEHRLSQELKDPIGLLLEQYARLRPGEQLWTQFVIQCDPEQHWVQEGVKYINDTVGKDEKKAHGPSMLGQLAAGVTWIPEQVVKEALGMVVGGEHDDKKEENPWKFLKTTPLDKVRLELVSNKISKPGMEVKIRHVYIAKNAAWMKSQRDKMLKGVFHQYAHQDSNAFGRVGRVAPKDDYFWQKWFKEIRATNIVRAYKHRDGERGGSPFILNIEEMATLWHLPSILERAPSISKTVAKRAEPPVQLELAEDSMADFTSAFSPSAKKMEALPVEFVEPVMPGGGVGLGVRSLNAPDHRSEPDAYSNIQPPTPSTLRIPTSNPQPPAPIPDALRVLLDPNVELEDVGLSNPAETKDRS